MGTMASQITSLTIVYSTVYSGADQRKYQSPASQAFAWGIHRGPVNSPHKWPVTRKMFPFDDVIMDIKCGGRHQIQCHSVLCMCSRAMWYGHLSFFTTRYFAERAWTLRNTILQRNNVPWKHDKLSSSYFIEEDKQYKTIFKVFHMVKVWWNFWINQPRKIQCSQSTLYILTGCSHVRCVKCQAQMCKFCVKNRKFFSLAIPCHGHLNGFCIN